MTTVKRPLATLAFAAGLLAAAAPAHAGTAVGNPGDPPAQKASICAFPDVCAKSNEALGARAVSRW